MQDMQSNIQNIKNDIRPLNQRAAGLQLHMEYVTGPNIQLIAEGFCNLAERIKPTLSAADNHLAYE